MIEIAISLAVIGLALVAIIGVLPLGINVQKDNRQETLVGQDASVFMGNIRQGTHGLDDLTNYVYAISNFWTLYGPFYNGVGASNRSGVNGYTYTNDFIAPSYPPVGSWLTNGANIIGLLSTPVYTADNNGAPLPNLVYGGYSNHVVAYVRSLSGAASEKPPQNNNTILGDSFSYKMICHNAPAAVDTNLFYQYPPWSGGYLASSNAPVYVSYLLNGKLTLWYATNDTTAYDYPGQSPRWIGIPAYSLELAANLHELRLTFLWPLLPSGNTGNGRHTFATTVAGRIVTDAVNPGVTNILYFFQPQSFTSAP